jgi:replicative DNA helicase
VTAPVAPEPAEHKYYRSLQSVATDYRRWATTSRRIPIGYSFFDDRTLGGAAAGELVIWTARSSVGKTTLALNVVNNNRTVPTVFFSLEMHGRYLIPRLSAMNTNTPTWQIETELRAGNSHPAVDRTVSEFPHLAIVDNGGMTSKRMGDALREVEDGIGRKVELVVVDYLELLRGSPALSDISGVEKIAWSMKDFSKDHDLVVLLVASGVAV